MPDSMHMIDAGLPRFSGGESTEEKVSAIQNYLFMLLEELRYLLRHLGKDNFTQAGAEEVVAQAFGGDGGTGDTIINLLEQSNVFETVIANTVISNSVVTNELYANYGDIADLTVWKLRTDYMRAQNYLRGSRADVNYISIHEEQIDFITASVASPLRTEQLTRDGRPYYWTDEGRTRMTSLEETPWPVMVYGYDELTKASFAFQHDGSNYVPIITFGAGDGQGRSQGFLQKVVDSLNVWYTARDGTNRGLFIGDDYTDIVGLRKTTRLDFSGWDSGFFMETVDGAISDTYSVAFDEDGYPVKITDGVGHETEVVW